MFKASCHCGNVQLTISVVPESVVRCNCSVCHRIGAEWAYFSPEQVQVSVSEQPTQTYRWGDEYIDFHHCPECGSNTHYTSTEKCKPARTGVNMRMADPALIRSIPVRKFDGADSWRFTDE